VINEKLGQTINCYLMQLTDNYCSLDNPDNGNHTITYDYPCSVLDVVKSLHVSHQFLQ